MPQTQLFYYTFVVFRYCPSVHPFRYKILPESHRRSFGSEEDNLLSIIAHNLLVYMLMVGLTAKETMDMIQGFTARTRLSTLEERLLQQTIKHVEQNVRNFWRERELRIMFSD